MIHSWNVLGHKNQLESLEKALALDRLPHGLLFAGPEGVGKLSIAKQLSSILLCETTSGCGTCDQCQGFKANSNADYMEVLSDGVIKIEHIRDLTYKLSLKPYAAKYKVAVIDSAEDMTEEAANALLKNLEEPKNHTIIILISSNPNKLPKTIVSRTQKINFGLVSEEEYLKLLPNKLSEKQKQLIQDLSIGQPGVAMRIANDKDLLSRLEEIGEYLERINSEKASQRLIAASELADWEDNQLNEFFNTWLNRLRTSLKNSPDTKTLKQTKAVAESFLQLQRNGNTKLVLANLMLNI